MYVGEKSCMCAKKSFARVPIGYFAAGGRTANLRLFTPPKSIASRRPQFVRRNIPVAEANQAESNYRPLMSADVGFENDVCYEISVPAENPTAAHSV
jgi:hypothetical protein